MDAIADHKSAGAIEIRTDDARQGVTGHNVRYVLGYGIAAVVLGFAIVGLLAAYGVFAPPA